MLLSQIEAFLTVAERRSVSAAAAVLYVTQPALTTRIKKLERELGIELFVRTARGMRLTAEGRAFRPHAQRALQSLASTVIIASSNAERVAGAVARLQAHKLPGEVRGEVVDAKDAAALKAFAAHVGAVDHIAWTSGDVPSSPELAMAGACCSG